MKLSEADPIPLPSAAALELEAASLTRGAAVARASPSRTGKQRRHLRSLGHALRATVQIGQQGLTRGVAEGLEEQVQQRELVKVRLLDSAPCGTRAAALWIHEATRADVVQILGRTLLVYRAHPEELRIRLPEPR